MSAAVRLVIFDVDGTLFGSLEMIVAAMTTVFQTVGMPVSDPLERRLIDGFDALADIRKVAT